jgi:periplasmic divalent cation tolerance protein
MDCIAVITTVGSLDEARRMARALVERKLAACAQISGIESFYTWKGAVENDQEYQVLFKTKSINYDAVERAIKELHSYELPAIHAFALARIDAAYAQWIANNSGGE